MAKQKISADQLISVIISGIEDVKGKEINILDLRDIENTVCDYFIICSGDSTVQVDGIAKSIPRHTRKEIQEKQWHDEGTSKEVGGRRVYVRVVVHIFYKTTREFYNIEGLWADAERTDIPNLD